MRDRRAAGLRQDASQVIQTLLELAADHLVAVHEQADGLAEEVVGAGHRPCDPRCAGLRDEGELGCAHTLERTHEGQPHLDPLARFALGDGHGAFADIVVAGPRHRAACSRRGAVEGGGGIRIKSGPRRPALPFPEVVHVLEDRLGGAGEDGRAGDVEVRGLQGDDDHQGEDERREDEEDFFDHGGFILRDRAREVPRCGRPSHGNYEHT